MARARTFVVLVGVAAGAAAIVAVLRHGRCATGRTVPGGTLIRNTAAYDALGHRLLLGRLFDRIVADVAAIAPDGARVLDVGCGPGRLSIRLSRQHSLDVTGLDLNPAMIQRARANAERPGDGDDRRPTFLVGDVASMAFPDESFDLAVSTLSMHHWGDPTAGLTEIGRVLRPGGRALVWDLRPGVVPLHRHTPDPVNQMHGSSLRVFTSTPWRWPWRFALTQRVELVRTDDEPKRSGAQVEAALEGGAAWIGSKNRYEEMGRRRGGKGEHSAR